MDMQKCEKRVSLSLSQLSRRDKKKNTLRFEIESVLENAAAYILHEILIVHLKLGLFFYVDITFTIP